MNKCTSQAKSITAGCEAQPKRTDKPKKIISHQEFMHIKHRKALFDRFLDPKSSTETKLITEIALFTIEVSDGELH